jgi:hypothetical protein
MRQKKVRLELMDGIIHYSLAIYFGLPVVFFIGYYISGKLGLFEISSSIDISVVVIPVIVLIPISLAFYFIQRGKLQFQLIQSSIGIEESKQLIREIAKEQKWGIRLFKDNVYTIKTNPGFVNQSWGQHITIEIVKEGLLVNSIFDTSKGSWLITFGSNQKNIDQIKKVFSSRTAEHVNQSKSR